MRALIFDTETSHLIENHTLPIAKQPEIWEFYGAIVDLESGEVEKECHHIIRPKVNMPEWSIKKQHVTEAELLLQPYFSQVSEDIKEFIENGPRPLAHNASFDLEVVETEFERLGQTIKWGGKPICTVEATIHLKGFRLGLSTLHELLFDCKFNDAHRAKSDTQALIKCACELFKRGEI